jgi:membrane-associated phospholipid phosphatase
MDLQFREARRLTIAFTLISTLIILALLPFSKLSLSYADADGIGILLSIFFVFSAYCWKRQMLRLAPSLEAIGIGLLLTIPVLISTYLAASFDRPLTDGVLIHADTALGFNWLAFIRTIDAHPVLSQILGIAYSSFSVQLVLLPLILGIAARYERIYVMIMSYGVICYISSIISVWFPALGTYAVYGVSQNQLHNLNAHFGFHFLHDFSLVREQPKFMLSLTSASGIVTFPSVHAAVAFLCAWAVWELKYVRYIIAGWNILMAVSAISNANHYLVDIIAGAAVAIVSIFAVNKAVYYARQLQWTPWLAHPAKGLLIRAKEHSGEGRTFLSTSDGRRYFGQSVKAISVQSLIFPGKSIDRRDP